MTSSLTILSKGSRRMLNLDALRQDADGGFPIPSAVLPGYNARLVAARECPGGGAVILFANRSLGRTVYSIAILARSGGYAFGGWPHEERNLATAVRQFAATCRDLEHKAVPMAA